MYFLWLSYTCATPFHSKLVNCLSIVNCFPVIHSSPTPRAINKRFEGHITQLARNLMPSSSSFLKGPARKVFTSSGRQRTARCLPRQFIADTEPRCVSSQICPPSFERINKCFLLSVLEKRRAWEEEFYESAKRTCSEDELQDLSFPKKIRGSSLGFLLFY